MKAKVILSILFCNFFFSQSLISGEIKKIEEKSFKLKSGGSVTLTNDEGSVVINSWDKDEVYLKMTKMVWHNRENQAEEIMERLAVGIDHSENRLMIREVDFRHKDRCNFRDFFDSDNWGHRAGYQIDFELTLPHKINLDIKNDEGEHLDETLGEGLPTKPILQKSK